MTGPGPAPRVTLKLATSLDGRIATAKGESQWITGPKAREAAHRLRAGHDAVMIGIETALADDPLLTVRIEGYGGPQPARVVLDSRQRLSIRSRLVAGARAVPLYVATTQAPDAALGEAGVRVLPIQANASGRPAPHAVLEALAGHGLRRIFIEGGGQVAASFLGSGLVDAMEWFRASILLGGAGRPAVGPLVMASLGDAPRFRRTEVIGLGEDLWERYERL